MATAVHYTDFSARCQKIIDMAMNGVGCRATARIMGVSLQHDFASAIKTQAAVGNLAHTSRQWRHHRLRGNGRTVGLRREFIAPALAYFTRMTGSGDGCCARIRWTHYGDAGASYEPAVTADVVYG